MTTHDFSTGNLGDVILTPARPESGFLDLRGTPKFYSPAEMNDLASRLAGGFARLFRRGDRVAIIAEITFLLRSPIWVSCGRVWWPFAELQTPERDN
jgi:hypothetical protein